MLVIAFAALLLLGSPSCAQRPANASICDYYAIQRYGANTSDTQTRLMQGIVSLAFGGGSNFTNGSASDITGILNPGVFENTTIDLAPWFDGSLLSTNLNNQGVSINWLDDGARAPLYDYLNGITLSPVFKNSSNEYRLFGHFYFVFGKLFGCTQGPPSPPSTGPPLSLAYVHKFMNLNNTQLGHFIDQLTKSTSYFGFSQQDSMTLDASLNNQYNVRCAPAVSVGPGQAPQLLSLCQAPSCPLAVPVADCAPYVNLTADGTGPSSPTTIGTASTAVPTATAYSSPPAASSTTASPSASATVAPAASSSLSSGAIAGIAIGGAAVLFIFIAVMFWLRRRRPAPAPMAAPPPQLIDQSYAHTPLSPYPNDKGHQHASYLSSGPGMAEMDSPRAGPQSPNSSHASYRYTYDPEHGNRVISTANANQVPVELGQADPRDQQMHQPDGQQPQYQEQLLPPTPQYVSPQSPPPHQQLR